MNEAPRSESIKRYACEGRRRSTFKGDPRERMRDWRGIPTKTGEGSSELALWHVLEEKCSGVIFLVWKNKQTVLRVYFVHMGLLDRCFVRAENCESK